MPLANAVISALANLFLLVLIPFSFYAGYHKWRHGRSLADIFERAGIKPSAGRFLVYASVFAAINVAALLIWSPSLEPFTREGSAQHAFAGLGLSGTSIAMALIYGIFKTGFAEEFLFRGLIAGSLARRLPLVWANLLQAAIFLLPHLVLLFIMPEWWWLLPIIFSASLLLGWLRIKSGSILGPWLIHATVNVATCMMVAIGTAV